MPFKAFLFCNIYIEKEHVLCLVNTDKLTVEKKGQVVFLPKFSF
tara:strand:+ start:815 stop:946 length:132 start_codon:yes stop_codon:yes gene_type:complete